MDLKWMSMNDVLLFTLILLHIECISNTSIQSKSMALCTFILFIWQMMKCSY